MGLIVRILSTVLLGAMLYGCVTHTEEPSTHLSASKLHTPQTATVTVGSLKGIVTADTTVSWFAEDLIDLSDSPVLSAGQAEETHLYLKKRIQEEFQNKGVKFSPESGSTRFQIIVAGAGNTKSTDNLHSLFKIYPGLGTGSLSRGAIMVGVLDTARNYAIWRGVVEGTLQEGLAFEERIARLDAAVTGLMSRVDI